jgi:hypothetical protein
MEHTILGQGESVKDYAVAYLGDEALPEGVDWVFITQGDTLVFAVKERAVSAELLAEAWGTFRELPALVSA